MYYLLVDLLSIRQSNRQAVYASKIIILTFLDFRVGSLLLPAFNIEKMLFLYLPISLIISKKSLILVCKIS